MSSLGLSHNDKQAIQSFTENLQALDNQEFASFTVSAHSGNEAAWSRFIKGAYNHPITWWIGIFQLQMQTGLWGHHYQASATLRANALWKISKPLRKEATGAIKGDDAPMLSAIVRYNWEHKKADIMGRLTGSQFTNYASTGGGLGKKRLSLSIKISVGATNFAISSYGAAIKALIEGSKGLDEIVQSILTGSAEKLPKSYKYDKNIKPSEEEQKLLKGVGTALESIMSLSQVNAVPVPIKEFCLRSENINLKGICK